MSKVIISPVIILIIISSLFISTSSSQNSIPIPDHTLEQESLDIRFDVSPDANWPIQRKYFINGTANETYEIWMSNMLGLNSVGIDIIHPPTVRTNESGNASFILIFTRERYQLFPEGSTFIYIHVHNANASKQERMFGWLTICYAEQFASTELFLQDQDIRIVDDRTVTIPVTITNGGNGLVRYNLSIANVDEWERKGVSFEFSEMIGMDVLQSREVNISMSVATYSSVADSYFTLNLEYSHSKTAPPEYGNTSIDIPLEVFNSGGLAPLGLETKLGVVMAWLFISTISVIGIIAILQRKDQQRFPQMYDSSEE